MQLTGLILFLVFFTEFGFSKTIEIRSENFHSKIVVLEGEIRYSEELIDLSLSEKKCNKLMMKKLNQDIEKHLKAAVPPMGRGLLLINVDGKARAFERNSPAGLYFYNFGEVMKTAKLEDRFSCR